MGKPVVRPARKAMGLFVRSSGYRRASCGGAVESVISELQTICLRVSVVNRFTSTGARRRSRRLSSRRRGSTAVEFAFVAPVFLLAFFVLIEFARLVMVQQALTDAARAGCRKAGLATTNSQSDAEAVVRNHLQSSMANAGDVNTCRVTINPSNLNGMASGTEITTSVEVNYSAVSWISSTFLGSVVLRRESTIKRE